MKLLQCALIASIAFVLTIQPASFNDKRSAKAGPSSSKLAAPSLHVDWKLAINPPVELVSSANGKYIAVVMQQGLVRCFGEGGRPVWSANLPDVDQVVLGADGSAVAYSHLNPAKTRVYLVDGTGDVRWHHNVDGAVWSADASPVAGQFAIGTGESYCYIYTFTGKRQRYKRFRVAGVPCSIAFHRTGESLLMGMWQDAGVGIYSVGGKKLDWRKGRGDRLHMINYSRRGNHAVILAKPNRNIPECSIAYTDANLNEIWRKDLYVYNIKVDISSNGEYVAAGYQRPITHKGEEILENRVALYDRNGELQWEKGGLFGKWRMLQIRPDGDLIMYDDTPSLYVLGESGKIILREKLNSRIRSFVKDDSGNRIVAYCGDGQLCAYSIK